jgi:phage recombination protein Bet
MAMNETALVAWELDQKELDIYRKHYAPESTTDIEWDIFLETCRAYRVSPLRKQIYIVSRYDSVKKRMVNLPQVSIGTLRLMALRTNEFEGTTEPEWGDEEGNWYTLWPKRLGAYPYASRIGVYRKGFRTPKWGVAYFHEMAQKKRDGTYTKFWLEMGIHMILKCAEADALRGAFEEECGGIYLHEEMNQADSDTQVVTIIPEVDTNDQNTNEALRETASRQRQEAQQTPVPTSKELYSHGVKKGVWTSVQSYCAFASVELGNGVVVTKDTVLTADQKIQIWQAIEKEPVQETDKAS